MEKNTQTAKSWGSKSWNSVQLTVHGQKNFFLNFQNHSDGTLTSKKAHILCLSVFWVSVCLVRSYEILQRGRIVLWQQQMQVYSYTVVLLPWYMHSNEFFLTIHLFLAIKMGYL